MIKELISQKEKKVEYVELIYDLIFVYIIGRNNTLLQTVTGGFIDGGKFMAYIISTLAVIQIWNYTTYYINIYGRNGIRDHVFLFINMLLIYFMAEGVNENWATYQYHIAWSLILVNIGVQYVIELRNHKSDEYALRRIRRLMLTLFGEAAIVLIALPFYGQTVSGIVSAAAIIFGIVSTTLAGRKNCACSGGVDFAHLTERAMLYVVFTFGEMIIVTASYFEGGFSANGAYFAVMAFLIVVGLFLSYEVMYDRIIDREMQSNGLHYMFIHIILIFSLNNITAALEFMRNTEVQLIPKTLFLIFSFLLYYASLISLGRYSKLTCVRNRKFYAVMCALAVSFTALMLLMREIMWANILISVIYIFAAVAVIYFSWKRADCKIK